MRVTGDQVLTWRLERQFVAPRTTLPAGDIAQRLCGIQAQVAACADLAIGLRRRTPDPGGAGAATGDGSLMKTWAMRGTLHLLTPGTAGAFLALIASARTWTRPTWQRAFGATPDEMRDLADAVAVMLEGRCLTRDELVTELVADPRFTAMEEQLRSGWGALLKPLAWQGVLCHGPARGSAVTFASPGSAVPGWTGLPGIDEAAPEAITAYLGAYGPATPETFDAWLTRGSLRKTLVRGWFADLGDALTAVEIDGAGGGFVLTENADELAGMPPRPTVRLLGAFDPYVLGPGTKDALTVPPGHRAAVSRAAGWISPVITVGGRVVGVWEVRDDEIRLSLFPGGPTPDADELAAEAAHVARASGRGALTVRRDNE